MRVAIIEDDPIIAMGLEERFQRLGCDVVGKADDSETARALIIGSRPDLILLDVELRDGPTGPSLSSPELTGGAMVVFLTGNAALIGEAQSRNVPVLAKPFRDTDLARLVEQAKTVNPAA